jgi:hypothetical protein
VVSLFLSHSSADDRMAEQLVTWLDEVGFAAVFLDFDPGRGIPVGRNWERELYTQLRRADGVVFLATPASVESKWCFAEIALARSLVAIQPGVAAGGSQAPVVNSWVRTS